MTTSHIDFISLPAIRIINDVINSSAGIGTGIETFPICDYVMQSVFMKMTGFQEQKMKSICWGLAMNDYEYRYDLMKAPLGECSSYDDKEEIYKDLITQIKKLNPTFRIGNYIDKVALLNDTAAQIRLCFGNTNLSISAQRRYDDCAIIWSNVKHAHFACNDTILFKTDPEFSLKTIYEDHLYRHRNRIAHNTQSYQQNLPTIKTLLSENYRYENYFLYFSMLILIDNLFMQLFRVYSDLQEENAQ